MFNFLKKEKSQTKIFSPARGELIPLGKVADSVFSEGMMGGGFAVIPKDSTIYSPVKGIISSVFPTKHAIGLETEKGEELLLHMGIDTVELKGEGFKIFVKEGDSVSETSKLAEMNLNFVKSKGKDTTIMVLFPNLSAFPVDIARKSIEAGEIVAMLP